VASHSVPVTEHYKGDQIWQDEMDKNCNISINTENVVNCLLVKWKANFADLDLNGGSIFKLTLNKMSYLHATVSHGNVSSGQ